MNLNSKYFDRVRVKPEQDRLKADASPTCEWDGCQRQGTHRAPKGRDHEGEYFQFCIDHVRDYNKAYNYFAGMDDTSISRYQKDAMTGHRPTWSMGVNRHDPAGGPATHGARATITDDPFGLADKAAIFGGTTQSAPRRKLKTIERRAFETLDIDEGAGADQIKARYKELVKKHHPDANGGSRGSEERLRQIIQAYNQLKSAGFC